MTTILQVIQNRPLRWVIAIVWTIFLSIILVQSESQPIINTGVQPEPPTLQRELVFLTAHLIAFGVTCTVWFWAWFGHLSLSKSLIFGIGCAIIIGSVTEYLQTYAPDRNPSLIDFLANWVGALFIAYMIWRKQDIITEYNTYPQ